MNANLFHVNGEDSSMIENELDVKIKHEKMSGVCNKICLENFPQRDFLLFQNENDLLNYYLTVINKSWEIDVNDFEIARKKGIFGYIEFLIKQIIWKSLKFYTYRIFSQQLEYNSEVRNAIKALHLAYEKKLNGLEEELDALLKREKNNGKS